MTEDPMILRLLPGLYRRRDADGALQALTGVLDACRATVERDIDALYRDWFVGTCDPAALSLLAGLVGRDALPAGVARPRALVADTVSMAQRRGTYPAAARMIEVMSGWPAIVSPDHTDPQRVIVEVWRQPTDRLVNVSPHPAEDVGARCYRLHPLGVDCRLVAMPRAWPGIAAMPMRHHDAPVGLEEVAALERSLTIHLRGGDGRWQPLPVDRISIDALGSWRDEATHDGDAPRAVVDPVLGRLQLDGWDGGHQDVLVSFAYAAPDAIGGGGYARPVSVTPPEEVWVAHVYRGATAAAAEGQPPRFASLAAALSAWRSVRGDAVIRILDSASERIGDLDIDDRTDVCADDPNRRRMLTIEAPAGDVAVLRGDIVARGHGIGLDLTLRGLWIEGTLWLGQHATARLEHCTVRAGGGVSRPAIFLQGGQLRLRDSVTGAFMLDRHATLDAATSVIDGGGRRLALAGDGTARLAGVTVLGDIEVAQIDADDTDIDAFHAERRATREALVRTALDEVLPAGIDATIVWR